MRASTPMRGRACALLLLCACVALSAVSVVTANMPLQVQTTSGPVMGFSQNGVDQWHAIPYAAPPLGPLRFAKPQPHAGWTDILYASGPGAVCLQPTADSPVAPAGTQGEEDCLLLNIFAPANRTGNQILPVYVWIHGGGWVSGSGVAIPGEYMAFQHRYIFVAVNYRLGPLGFWASQALANENKDGAAGNWGLLDQIRALQWVQENIQRFGGDPSRVTIGGESAGAISQCALIASPLAKGLFVGSILESGLCDNPSWWSTAPVAFAWGKTAAGIVQCANAGGTAEIACLRAMNSTDLVALTSPSALPKVDGTSTQPYASLFYPVWSWSAVIDGALLTHTPGGMMAAGEYNRVPVIAGTNGNEMWNLAPAVSAMIFNVSWPLLDDDQFMRVLAHFVGPSPASQQAILAAYPAEQYSSPSERMLPLLRDYMFTCPTQRALLNMESTGAPALFNYVFTYRGAANTTEPFHSAELAYVFGGESAAPRDQSMAADIGLLWKNFIYAGTPNPLPADSPIAWWQSYEPVTRGALLLDQPLAWAAEEEANPCDVWGSIVPWVPPVPTTAVRGEDARVALA